LFYRRIKSRIGGKGAITATAHKLAGLVYRMLRYGRDYVKQSMAEYEKKMRDQQKRALQRKAAALGCELVAKQPAVPQPQPVPSQESASGRGPAASYQPSQYQRKYTPGAKPG
jgi:hypothetical protein